jgi:hypothetical protein
MPIVVSSGQILNLGNITLSPGDWDVEGYAISYSTSSSVMENIFRVGISDTLTTFNIPYGFSKISGIITNFPTVYLPTIGNALVTPTLRVNITTTETRYILAQSFYTAPSGQFISLAGSIYAIRRR